MKLNRLLPTIALVFGFGASLGLGASNLPDFNGWLNGGDGMFEAARLYDQAPRPIFVYFYTDWCGYCRQFERELLSSSEVGEFLDDVVRVRVNPESGPLEASLGQRYGVRGYPALFVHSAESKTITRIDRTEVVDGKARLKSPAAFVDVLKQAGAH